MIIIQRKAVVEDYDGASKMDYALLTLGGSAPLTRGHAATAGISSFGGA